MTDPHLTGDGEAMGEGVDTTPSPEGTHDVVDGTLISGDVDEAQAESEDVQQETNPLAEMEKLVAERTADLQRLQAEYVNYKRRVDRDRDLARQAGVEVVVTDIMPVLDAIVLAKQHEDFGGGFKMVADELQKVTTKHGLEGFGAVGDEFDPALHEALMALPMDEPVSVTTVSQVMQQGYRLKGRVIRPARVAVANP